jgi:hypothetical protein
MLEFSRPVLPPSPQFCPPSLFGVIASVVPQTISAPEVRRCDSGPLFGGSSLQRFGVVEGYHSHIRSERGDAGLVEKTGEEADRERFRVQPLIMWLKAVFS